MQIILTKEEYDKLKPIDGYTGYELANALVEKCKLNKEVNETTFTIHTKDNKRDNIFQTLKFIKFKHKKKTVTIEIINNYSLFF